MTYLLLALTIAGFGLEVLVDGRLETFSLERNFRTATLYQLGALYRPAIVGGEYGRLLSVMFVHANLLHLLYNAVMLLALGWRLESYLGGWWLGLIYFLTGLGASVLSFGLTLESREMAVGASGAIFGLVGGLMGFSFRNWHLFARQSGVLVLALGLNWLVLGSVPGVDNWGHLGGLAGGIWLGYLGTPRYLQTQPDLAARRNLLLAGLGWSALLFVLFFFFARF